MATPTHADIWKKMSTIDVSEFVKSRGVGNRTLSWIPWSDCLALLQAHYPNFEYEFFPVTLYPDGSAEVSCEVTIGDVSRRVDLPVMDHKFNAIVAGAGSSPSSRDINDGRWRAFVKAVAILTGLGFQLYRDGSGVPVPVKATKATKKATTENKQTLSERVAFLEAILDACEDHGGLDAKTLSLGRDIIKDGGPLDRVEKAITHLQKEIDRV
jgi:hypothetical protein|tara:strand:- start:2048 stop:2683 length:636 start_codon:yes stop_codon:yes gene_type:complete